MAKVVFHHGASPIMSDHTPGSAVTAGDVIVAGNMPVVAHRDIAASALGAGGVRNGVYKGTSAAACTGGTKAYWDPTGSGDSSGGFTSTAGVLKHFGYFEPDSAAAGADETVYVIHAPEGTP